MRLAFDIETDGLLPELTKVHSLVIKDLDDGHVTSYANQSRYVAVEDGLASLESADLIVAHNAIRFDIPAITKVYPWFSTRGTVRDTLLLSQLKYPEIRVRDQVLSLQGKLPAKLIGRHSLAAWGYRLGLHKGVYEGGFDAWSRDLQEYCERDTEVLAKLWHTMQRLPYSERAVKMEHSFAEIMFKQEQSGWPFDEKAAVELYIKLSGKRDDIKENPGEGFSPRKVLMKSQWWIAEGHETLYETKKQGIDAGHHPDILRRGPHKTKSIPFNPGSRDQIASRLIEKYNWKPTRFTPNGKPQIDETVLSELVYPEAKVLAEHFMIQKRISQLAEGDTAWLKMAKLGADGIARIHGQVRTLGTVTRRCSHNKPNVSAVPSVRHPFGHECRSLFVTPPGYLLVGVDASGLELRCLAHYLASFDGGAYGRVAAGGDVHSLTMDATGITDRDMAKTFIYALLYGAGDEKLGAIIGKGAGAGRKLRSKFFAAMTAFAMLVKALARRHDAMQSIKAIDGGELTVRSKHSALNTLLQSAGAIAVKTATVIFYDRCDAAGLEWGQDYWIAGHIHDEMQIICKEGLEDDIGNTATSAIREAGEELGFRCPLDAEYKVGRTWADTH